MKLVKIQLAAIFKINVSNQHYKNYLSNIIKNKMLFTKSTNNIMSLKL